MLFDLRLALRTLRTSPGFTVVALLSIGLAVGLGSTMYALVDAVVRPYVAFTKPNELYHVHHSGGHRTSGPGRWQPFLRLQSDDGFRKAVAAWTLPRNVQVAAANRSEHLSAAHVSTNLFGVLGVRPRKGTTFQPDQNGTIDEPVAILSDIAWRRLTGEVAFRPDVSITVDGMTHTVIGVMPAGMNYPYGTDVWLPIPVKSRLTGDGIGSPATVMRVAGFDTSAIQGRLDVLAAHMTAELHLQSDPVRLSLDPLRAGFSRLRPVHMALGLAICVVVLIACTNLSTLMLVRTTARQRELAVRAAIGATRARLVRLVLSEAGLIAVGGAILGVLISIWSTELLRASIPFAADQQGFVAPRMSARVVGVAGALAFLLVMAASALPAFRASVARPDGALKDGSGTHTSRLRWRYHPLVIATLGLSLTLTMASSLLLRSSAEVHRFTYGYDADRLSRGVLRAPAMYAQSDSDLARFHNEMLAAARGLDGIENAALYGSDSPVKQNITVEDPGAGSRERFHPSYRVVSHSFLETIGVRIVEGRDFLPGDAELGGVAIVDERMARELFPNAHPIGRMLKLGRERSDAPWVRVVGVAQSVFLAPAPGEFPLPELYVVRTHDDAIREMAIVARRAEDRQNVNGVLALALNALAPEALVSARVEPWTRELEALEQRTEFLTMLLVAFAACGVLTAIVGLYGVLAYTVQQRTRELAVRVALGATRRNILSIVLHDSAVMILAGIGFGAFVGLWAVRRFRFAVFGLDTYDPISLIVAEIVLLVVAFLAAWGPARTAMHSDPVHVLRSL